MKIWKLKREFLRLAEQLKGLMAQLWEPWEKRRYERQRPVLVHRWDGNITLDKQHPRVAVYLLFQPEGLSQSTYLACEYLVRKGFAPMVVSNAPIKPADLERLQAVSWQVVQRPNYGYDFGGYREGILQLAELVCHPDELILVNDSIWFPFPAFCDPIDAVRREKGGLVGLLSAEDKRSHIVLGTARPPFVCSFFLFFRREAIDHPAFNHFWSSYRHTNSKYKTIRRGERGLTYALRSAGVECRSVMNRVSFDHWLETLGLPQIEKALAFLVTHAESIRIQLELLKSGPVHDAEWLDDARDLLFTATDGQNYPSLLPYVFFSGLGCGYFKKALDPINADAIRIVLAQADIEEPIFKQELSQRVNGR
jgi:hypothetical protein